MRVRAQHRLQPLPAAEADTVLITDAFDNPIAIAIQHADGVILASTLGQPDFESLLHMAGVRNTVYVADSSDKLLDVTKMRF